MSLLLVVSSIASRYNTCHPLQILHVCITVILAEISVKSFLFNRQNWHRMFIHLVTIYLGLTQESHATFITSFYCHLVFFLTLFIVSIFSLYYSPRDSSYLSVPSFFFPSSFNFKSLRLSINLSIPCCPSHVLDIAISSTGSLTVGSCSTGGIPFIA